VKQHVSLRRTKDDTIGPFFAIVTKKTAAHKLIRIRRPTRESGCRFKDIQSHKVVREDFCSVSTTLFESRYDNLPRRWALTSRNRGVSDASIKLSWYTQTLSIILRKPATHSDIKYREAGSFSTQRLPSPTVHHFEAATNSLTAHSSSADHLFHPRPAYSTERP
jgi:hypothetical protein